MKSRQKAKVFFNSMPAGILMRTEDGFSFEYYDEYLRNKDLPAISLSFPKRSEPFRSNVLFPFFFGLLSEGENKAIACSALRIDENDHFTLLLKTAQTDTIGAVTVREDEA